MVIGAVCTVSPARALFGQALDALFPREPLAVIGLGALLLLLIYVLHQLSILSDRVARLTQEIALRESKSDGSGRQQR
jgi:type II secretory pathway component PulM